MPATPGPMLTLPKDTFERLAEFRYRLRRFLRFSEEITRSHGVTALQYQLLLQLRGYPGREWASIAELAERLQAQHHGVVALVSRCEVMALVRRAPSASDKRQVEVHLTPAGAAMVETLAALHLEELGSLGAEFLLNLPHGAGLPTAPGGEARRRGE